MKVEDYVRTDYGISKIKEIYSEKTMAFIETDNGIGDCSFFQNGKLRKGIIILEEDYRNFIDNNVKKKLIDLIEAGDYVNGARVTNFMFDGDKKIGVFVEATAWGYDANEIKSIVTKEQFESMEYKVGE